MKADRRNITVTNERVDDAFNKSENVSKFIEKCVLHYLDENEKDYIEREEFEILNQNFIQQKVILDEIAKKLFN